MKLRGKYKCILHQVRNLILELFPWQFKPVCVHHSLELCWSEIASVRRHLCDFSVV